MSKSDFDEFMRETLIEMQNPDPGLSYYHFTMLGSEDGQIMWSVYSRWIGFKSKDPLIEIRKPSLIDAKKMVKFWNDIEAPYWVINNDFQLAIFARSGGCALIEKGIAEKHMSDFFQDQECISAGYSGFASAKEVRESCKNRAPGKKLRMKIIKRDGFRCKVCGRRPADHVDVELHVHHIKPWASGGFTIEDNLITLCNTCHSGLDPHYEERLFNLLGYGPEQATARGYKKKLLAGMEQYRKLTKSFD